VQYGLQALNEGKITFEPGYLEVNARIGGLDAYDADETYAAGVWVAIPVALRVAPMRTRAASTLRAAGWCRFPIVDDPLLCGPRRARRRRSMP